MTITANLVRVDYAADGSTTTFPVPFIFYGADELVVYERASGGTLTALSRGTHYTVTGGNGATGTVVANSAPASPLVWSVVRNTTATQQAAFNNADPLPAPTVERAYDRLTAMVQELQAQMARAVRVSPGEQAEVSQLPIPATRANLALTFDAAGNPTASTLATGSVAVSAAMQPVLNAATLAAGRLILGSRQHVDAVKDYAADNTGAADASTAIQSAINGLTAGVVYLRPGTYKVSSDITMKPGVAIVADNPRLVTLTAAANNVKILKYVAAATQTGFTVQGVGFAAGGFTGVRAISLDGTDSAKQLLQVNIEDILITGGARGVDLKFCADSILERVRTSSTILGIYLDQCANTEVAGGYSNGGSGAGITVVGGAGTTDEVIRIHGYATSGQAQGVAISGQDWGQITGCSFITCSGGPLSFISSSNWQISGCQLVTGGGAPATPGASADALSNGLQFNNNVLTNNTFGFNLLGTQHVVTGNRLASNSSNDINLQATKCSVVGNVCDSTGTAYSITEQVGSDFNNISANTTNGTVYIAGANSVTTGNNLVY